MREAAQIAQAEEFIEEKKKKYQSHIAQGGSNVSGGQKQRLSIARAIAKHPELFIFDDSFSALDYKTDVALRKALKKKTQDSTVLIVQSRSLCWMKAKSPESERTENFWKTVKFIVRLQLLSFQSQS